MDISESRKIWSGHYLNHWAIQISLIERTYSANIKPGILRVADKNKIVDGNGALSSFAELLSKKTIVFTNVPRSLGGWMMMENFMNGFPGREMQIRKALGKVLGPEKSSFFFNKFLEYFFMDEDAVFLRTPGLNSLRVPFNYRHLEDDMNPFVVLPEGFKHIDRIVDICARHGIYVLLDLHSAPGGQSQDWHCDDPIGYAAFWDQKPFQDRIVNPWRTIAARLTLTIWLDGNTFAMDFSGFTKVIPNTVYAIHDYCGYGIPNRIGRYQGKPEQDRYIRSMYDRKVEFMKEHNVPIWNGSSTDSDMDALHSLT
ncbi:glycoside hydrolase superfamily [Lipomyces orientalis]|uniref:Glycoside hydrolase superfamily n=1 Tax=Lipomyces orientalis TaxID=1233043 RepID=A0ACC3THZ7_9ASCO